MPTKSNSNSKSNDNNGARPHDAGTGRFVTPDYAKAHPKTTFFESPRKVAPKKGK